MSSGTQPFSSSIEAWLSHSEAKHCSAVSCRTGAFEFEKCCKRAPNVVEMQNCFRVTGTKEWIAFAQLHCCDDGPAVKMWNTFSRLAVDGAMCLDACSRQWLKPQDALECDCEKQLLRKLFVAAVLPDEEKIYWNEWLERVWAPSEQEYHSQRNLSRAPRHRSIELLLHALGLLEAVLAGPGLANEPPSGFPFRWHHNGHFLPFQDAIELHQTIWERVSSMQAQSSTIRQPSRQSCNMYSVDEPVHIAMVASVGEPVFGQKAMATIRSALHFACRKRIHFHLFVDMRGDSDVQKALSTSLDPHLSNRIAAVSVLGESVMHRAWSLIKHRVPAACVNAFGSAWAGNYGAPGWMRMFPHEVFVDGPEHVIWVDAGDYVFMADPALLLDAHIIATSGKAVASYPEGNVFPVQVFALSKMRDVGWTEVATSALRKQWRKGNDTRGWLCYRGEGSMMHIMTESPLFSPVAAEWAHEPRCLSFVGSGVTNYFQYDHNRELWDKHLHSGLVSPTFAYVFCPGFAEQVLHVLTLGGCFTHPIFSVELAQALWIANETLRLRGKSNGFIESPVFGNQRIRCGKRVFGMHMIRAFHSMVPWSLKFLDFWSDRSSLWGRKDDVARKIPTSL